MPSHVPDPADLLDAAADHIENYGHCKGMLEDKWGRNCAIGALQAAAGYSAKTVRMEFWGDVVAMITVDAVEKQLGLSAETTPQNRRPLVHWNDLLDTTGEDVVNAMRKAALSLREKVNPDE